jgi:alkanesulfonate monooxygenase SsuD/methylene tetrahydromethanopterin reductase-like flavin-dependent oxidoreductase (luciferase family)
VRVGIQLDMRNPPPWRRDWTVHYESWLDLLATADVAGLDGVWLSEHHLFEDGYLPQPLTFAAAIAARTARLRIGTAIMVAPLRDPLHIAEQASIVDILSGGRLDLGLGAGYLPREFEAFGRRPDRRFALTERCLVELARRFAEGDVSPPPVQSPIPLWGGFHGPRGVALAGRLGIGLIGTGPSLLPIYERALEAAGHPPGTARMVADLGFVLADDPESAWHAIAPHFAYMWGTYIRQGGGAAAGLSGNALDHTGWVGKGQTGVEIRWHPERGNVEGRAIRFRVLTPAQAEARVRKKIVGMPIRELTCWASIAGMPAELTARHLELLGGDLRARIADV